MDEPRYTALLSLIDKAAQGQAQSLVMRFTDELSDFVNKRERTPEWLAVREALNDLRAVLHAAGKTFYARHVLEQLVKNALEEAERAVAAKADMFEGEDTPAPRGRAKAPAGEVSP